MENQSEDERKNLSDNGCNCSLRLFQLKSQQSASVPEMQASKHSIPALPPLELQKRKPNQRYCRQPAASSKESSVCPMY